MGINPGPTQQIRLSNNIRVFFNLSLVTGKALNEFYHFTAIGAADIDRINLP